MSSAKIFNMSRRRRCLTAKEVIDGLDDESSGSELADDSDDSSYNDDDSTDNDSDDQSQSGSQIEDEVEHDDGNDHNVSANSSLICKDVKYRVYKGQHCEITFWSTSNCYTSSFSTHQQLSNGISSELFT